MFGNAIGIRAVTGRIFIRHFAGGAPVGCASLRESRRGSEGRQPAFEISSPGRRACPPTTVCSKVAHANIYGKFRARSKRYFVRSCCSECTRGTVLTCRRKRRNRAGRAAASPKWEPHPGYLTPQGGEQTSEGKGGGARCRRAANPLSVPESMPSNGRVFESSRCQHLRRVSFERQTVFRMKLLFGVRFRIRSSVSP